MWQFSPMFFHGKGFYFTMFTVHVHLEGYGQLSLTYETWKFAFLFSLFYSSLLSLPFLVLLSLPLASLSRFPFQGLFRKILPSLSPLSLFHVYGYMPWQTSCTDVNCSRSGPLYVDSISLYNSRHTIYCLLAAGRWIKRLVCWGRIVTVLRDHIGRYVEMTFLHCSKERAYVSCFAAFS